jgi:hypothetical protein
MQVSIKFDVNAGRLALAMVFNALESTENVQYGWSTGPDERLTRHVQSMTKTQAMAALKSAYHAYGTTAWPNMPECAEQAFDQARIKARAWLGTTPSQDEPVTVLNVFQAQ